MTHRDIHGDVIPVKQDSDIKYLAQCDNNVHWGRYVFWLIFFTPMIIVLLLLDFMESNHLVRVDGVVYEVDEHTMKRLVGRG